jgi:hypothetical protein
LPEYSLSQAAIGPLKPRPLLALLSPLLRFLQTGAWITATPNPIPGGTDQGKTTIKWHSGGSTGAVYVGGTDSLFADGSDGSVDASWIDLSRSTEFLLFSDRDRKTLLARVSVTGSKQ